MAEKFVILSTYGPDDAEKATIPFVMATAAQASDVEVLVGLQANAVRVAVKGVAETIQAEGFPPLSQLLEAYLEAGGKLYCCGPCVKSRGINPSTDFVEGASVVNAATLVKEISDANKALVY